MTARYFNGLQGNAFDVHIQIEAPALLFHDNNLQIKENWPLDDITIIAYPENGHDAILSIKHNPEARLIISQDDFNILSKQLPKQNHPFHIPLSLKLLFSIAIFAIFAAIGFYNAIPHFAKELTPLVPYKWSNQLGEWTSEAIHSDYDACTDPEAIAALRKISNQLQAHTNIKHPIHLYVIKDEMANAFAAAAGHITFFSQTLKDAESESEIAGILAHEMAHVELQHPTESLIRSLGSYLFLNMILGNSGSEEIFLLGNSLKQLQYGRDAEREADEMATQTLKKAGYNTQGLIAFFTRMKEENKELEKFLNYTPYLSSHPMIDERVKALATQSANMPNNNVLNEKEWQALKRICD